MTTQEKLPERAGGSGGGSPGFMLSCTGLYAGTVLWAAVVVLVTTGVASAVEVKQLFNQAAEAQAKGDLPAAVHLYTEALKQSPRLTQARTNRAAALAGLGKFEEAIADYRTALAQQPNNPDIQQNLALAYYARGDAAAARDLLRRIHRGKPGDIRITTMLAECELRTGRPQEALALIKPLADTRPDDRELLYLRGMALIRTGHPEEGAEDVERVAKQTHSADAYLLAGATHLNLGRFDRARADLDAAVELNPDLPGVLSWAGLARDRAGDEESAKELLRRAVKKNPADFDGNLHLGAILYREKEYAEAQQYVDSAFRLHPESPMAQYASALLKAAIGKRSEAIADLEKIVRSSPDWVEPHAKLASLYFQEHRDADGNKEQAILEKLNSDHTGKSSPFEN